MFVVEERKAMCWQKT